MNRPRERHAADWLERLVSLEPIDDRDYEPQASAWYAEATARKRRFARPRRWAPWLGLSIAASAAVGVAFALDRPIDAPVLPSAPALLRTEARASLPPVISIGPGSLVTLEPIPRTLPGGAVVPFDVALSTESDRTASLKIGDQTEIRLDPGAEVWLDAPNADGDRLALKRGRIFVDVGSGARPFYLRFGDHEATVVTRSGAFGALVPTPGRWSAAVVRGELQADRPAGMRPAVAGELLSGEVGGSVSVQSLPRELRLTARIERSRAGWVARGLVDVLARLEVEGRPIAVDSSGAFEHPLGSRQRRLCISALDAAGRRVERILASPETRPAGSFPRSPRSASPQDATGPSAASPVSEPERIRAHPMEWEQ